MDDSLRLDRLERCVYDRCVDGIVADLRPQGLPVRNIPLKVIRNDFGVILGQILADGLCNRRVRSTLEWYHELV